MAEENKTPPIVDKDSGKGQKEETVTISKDQFNLILEEIQKLKEGQKELVDTSSPDQIKKIEAIRAKGGLVKSVKIASLDGKLVESWVTTKNESYVDPLTGKSVFEHSSKYTFFDGKTKEMDQTDFARTRVMESFEVIKEGKDKVGNIIFTVTTKDGKEFEIDSRYIN